MKTQIRFSTFETNSSSTHSLIILNEQEYEDYENGNILYDRNGYEVPAEKYNELYEKNLKRAKKLFELKSSETRWHYSPEEMAKYETKRDLDLNEMEIIHEEREINGITVHAISIYGYD